MKIRGLARVGLVVFVSSFYLMAAYAVDYTGENSEDPFFYEKTEKKGSAPSGADLQGSMLLTGVLWNVNPPKAIISGKIVTVGDKIGAAEVIEINKDGVRMKADGNEFTLKMDSRAVK